MYYWVDRPSHFVSVAPVEAKPLHWPVPMDRLPYTVHSVYFGDAVMDQSCCPVEKGLDICERCPDDDHVMGILTALEGTVYLIQHYGTAWPIDLDPAQAPMHPGLCDGHRVVTDLEMKQREAA